MTTLKKRSRVAVAVATAALSAASVFALASPASAAATPPNAVRNLTANGGAGQIVVNWDAPDTGEAPTSYVVVIENANGIVGSPTIVLAPATTATIKLGAGTYNVTVFPRNEYSAVGNANGRSILGVAVTAPVTPAPAPTVVSTLPYRPYANWSDMIDQEYQLFTGCGKLGRLPRLDEKTFWLYNLQNKPFTADETYQATNNAAGTYLSIRSAAEFSRLTNGATFAPPVTIVTPGYENSIAYKELYAFYYRYQTTNPTGPNDAPADINGDDQFSNAELTAARDASDDFARFSDYLINGFTINGFGTIKGFGQRVFEVAAPQARNDVFFARRSVFKTQLAEDAEQTDGPAYRLYTAYFSRIPDFNGLCYWSNKLRSGMSLLTVSDFFSKSSEFVNTYGAYDTYGTENPTATTDAAEFVALIYKNVLVRDPDGAGIAFWTRQLQTERYSPGEVMIGFSESQEFKTRIAPRVGAGIGFAHLLGRMPTEAEYVLNEFFGDYFATSPSILGFSYLGDGLYEVIIDSAEYKVRAAL